jgi:hypothetical protein
MASIVDQTPCTAENAASVFETRIHERDDDLPEASPADHSMLQSKVCLELIRLYCLFVCFSNVNFK